MKVVHFIATLDVGGAEKQLLTLCEEQLKHGYEVIVIPLKGSNTLAPEFQSIGVDVRNQLRNRNTVSQYVRLLGFNPGLSGYLIHAHSAKIQLLLTLLPFSLKNRFIVSKHDAMQFISQVPLPISRILWKWVQIRSSKVLTISKSIVHEMNNRKEWIDQKKSTVIYYGMSEKDIFEIGHESRERCRENWGLGNQDFVIGTVGRLVKEKNHLFLLDVFEQLLKVQPNSYLVICGYGPLEKEIREKIEKLGIASKVRILNNVKNTMKVYAGFDLFVLPSLTEGFGLVLLEAMSAELPIVAANVGAIPEVLSENYRFMFNPTRSEELLERLVSSTEMSVRREQSQQTTLRLKNFTSQAMFRNMDSLYRSLQF
jgi:glycosyltransferase involved in cell wall biosynthesis